MILFAIILFAIVLFFAWISAFTMWANSATKPIERTYFEMRMVTGEATLKEKVFEFIKRLIFGLINPLYGITALVIVGLICLINYIFTGDISWVF